MVHLFRQLVIIAFVLSVVSPANAVVVPITEYIQGISDIWKSKGNEDDFKYANGECDASNGEYEDEDEATTGFTNATCTLITKKGGKKCQKCTCNSSTYKFKDSDCTGASMIGSGNYCKVGSNTYYESCACNTSSKWEAESFYVRVPTKDEYTGTVAQAKATHGSGESVRCYRYDQFICSSGTKVPNSNIRSFDNEKGTFNNSGESTLITYKGTQNTKTYDSTKSTVCATSVTISEPLYDVSQKDKLRNDYPCHKIDCDSSTSYLSMGYCYFYECSGDGSCVTGTPECANITSYSTDIYSTSTKASGGNLTCKKVTGCVTTYNSTTPYICTGDKTSMTNVALVTASSTDSKVCYKAVKDSCDFGLFGYHDMGEATYDEYEKLLSDAKSDGNGVTYTVEGNIVETGASGSDMVHYIICRYASGCATGYVNTACWDGCMAWFVN